MRIFAENICFRLKILFFCLFCKKKKRSLSEIFQPITNNSDKNCKITCLFLFVAVFGPKLFNFPVEKLKFSTRGGGGF